MPRGRVMEMQAGWQSRPASGEMPPRGWGGFSLGGSCRGLLCCRWWDQRRSWSPARLQGHGLVVALVSQHSGRRCQALWQWPLCRSPGSCPVLVVSLVPPPARCGTCTGLRGGRGRRVCWCPAAPLPTLGTGLQEAAGPLRPGSLGGFCMQTCPERSQDIGEKCAEAWIFGRSLEPRTGKCPPRCCAPSRARWELLIQQGGSPRSRNWAAEDDPQRCTEMSPRLSFKAVLPKPSGPLSSVFRWAEVGLERFMWAPRACEPIDFWEGRDWDTHPQGFACDWCSWEALPQTFPTWLRQPKAFWAVAR